MNYQWRNDRKPDENGEYALDITTTAGKRVSTFKAQTMEDMVDQLAEAQVLASRKLGRLMKPDRVQRQPFRPQPKSLTTADRERLAMDITDPDKVAEVVAEIVERTAGASPALMAEKLAENDEDARAAFEGAETDAFLLEYPNYFPTPENQQAMFAEMNRLGYSVTRNNLAIAFEHLLSEGKMRMRDDITPQPSEPSDEVPPTSQEEVRHEPGEPRRALRSTGLRSTDTTAMRLPPKPKKPLITRRELAYMGKAELTERLRDPAFRQAVDELA